MHKHLLGYREVIPDQTIPEKWQEIKLNTGGTQSTLQDIKMTERAGGYCFKDSSKIYTRNRFIYWRSNHDVLELVDVSLDLNLSGNQIRLKFTNSPLLDGITIHEANGYVMLLVATVSSVHRITFPHPDNMQIDNLLSHSDVTLPSIFHDGNLSHNCHVLTNAGSPLPNAAATWLSPSADHGVFALAFNSGTITCVTMDYTSGSVTSLDVKEDSYVPKFFANLTGVLRGRTMESQACTSLVLASLHGELLLFGACRDGELRMWSARRGSCVATCPLLADGFEGRQHLQGAQGHVVRSCVDNSGTVSLAVFLCLGSESQIVIFRPVLDQASYRFIRVAALFAQQQDLVDFALSETHIWALWSNSQGEASLSSALLHNNSGLGLQWLPSSLESSRERDCLGIEPGTDPRQLYCSYIFHPGQFQLAVITRALSIYSRQPSLSELNLSIAVLKEKVCQAVEMEIHSEVEMCEINDDVYLDIASRCWSRFYSCCLQYHLSGARPLGVLALGPPQGAVIIRRALISLVRPVDAIEHLVLCGDSTGISTQYFSCIPELADEPGLSDLIRLVGGLVMLERRLSEDAKCEVEKRLYELRQPSHIMADLVLKLKTGDDAAFSTIFLDSLWTHLESIKNICGAMRLLLNTLNIAIKYNCENVKSTHTQARSAIALSHLYGGNFGMSMIAESLRQIASVRFSICRNLLILWYLMENADYENGEQLQSIRPEMQMYLQAYGIMLWLCETPTSPTLPTNMLESSILRFSSLQLKASLPSINTMPKRTLTLLELFLQGAGSSKVLSDLTKLTVVDSTVSWPSTMLPFISILGKLVWPVGGHFTFGEWLIGSGQHLLLQEYVRLLRSWCEWNRCSRQFILAVSLLETGEPHKALDLFLQASNGVSSEPFLINKIMSGRASGKDHDRVIYCLKVLKLFEEHGASDCIITLAQTAIGIAEADDPNVAMFQSIIFKKHLLLEHFEDAYTSLSCNPDSEMRKDCLRELVGVLFSKKKLDLLLSFPYVEFYEDFQKIVEGRARASDIMSTQYYNFLFSFYITNGNMRKAAATMYEQACRLNSECPSSLNALQKQSHCLLSTLTSLHLVSSRYAWLVKPQDRNALEYGHTSKRDSHGDKIPTKEKVTVVDIEYIENELEVVNARLKLAKYSSELQSIVGADVHELVGCLSSVGLFSTAISLCTRLKLTLRVPFEYLAAACVRLTEHEDPDDWNWMILNDLSDLGINETNVAVVAWRLLQILLEKHEKDRSTELHMAVTKRLYGLGAFLPTWLIGSYKLRNASELLRLTVLAGRLIEATELCKELLWAILGRGYELFGMDTYLLSTAPPVCTPIATIDHLLFELDYLKSDPVYDKCYKELNEVVEYYMNQVKKTSEDMVNLKKQSVRNV